jgi:uncharacterized protein (TIGR00730 family)
VERKVKLTFGKRNNIKPGRAEKRMKKKQVKNICVYCGANAGTHPASAEAARTLGRAMAKQGIGRVYGGASVGLMGELARAVLDAGGRVTGVIPAKLPTNEVPLGKVQELIYVDTFHERKMLMFKLSDAFVALPGGVGTLEELVEQITWVQLAHHSKPVVIANIENYWQPLLALFDQMRSLRFIPPSLDVTYHVVEHAQEIVPLLLRLPAPEELQEAPDFEVL